MKKTIAITLGLLITTIFYLSANMGILDLFSNKKEKLNAPSDVNASGSFYDFKMKALSGGKEIDMSDFKGKKLVVINVASKCGYTPQYADWEEFNKQNGDKIVVLGFPANDFLRQEPGSNDEIASFCQKNYGVTFQMFEKVDVTGKDQHPMFKWLSTKSLNGWNGKSPSWNFCKYVIDENGKLTHFFASGVKPKDDDFLKAVGLK